MLPVSNDTVLRVVRAQARPRTDPLNVVGIDDWAFRRNHSYGTIVCDLERRRIVTLLPDREMATVEAWLAGHPDIGVLSRDRGGGYGEAASKALPRAVQVADRWHLMENASAAFLGAVRKSMRPIRAAIGATTINPELLTCAAFNFAKNGGLMNYSTDINLIGQYRQAAGYVDRILKGAKPGDLPIQEADRYTFIINLKTAKALVLDVPEALLATADEVIK
jgi:Transposase/ABC transporter substrate binding protein